MAQEGFIFVYIDSNVIVSSKIRSEATHKESKKFMRHVLQNKDHTVVFTTSIFTFLELASAMIRRTKSKDKAYSLIYQISKSWKNSIYPLPIIYDKNPTITKMVDELIETAIKCRTSSADAIHAHTVSENYTDYFVTWNKPHFKYLKKQIKDLKILDPTEMLEEFHNKVQRI